MRVTAAITLESSPRRIVVRSVNWLGDSIMAMPALARLRERFPEAHIALQTQEKLGDLWRNHPAINEVIVCTPRDGLLSVARRLREKRFDLALVLPNSQRSAYEVWLARIPRRIGYANGWRGRFLTHGISERSDRVRLKKRSVREIRKLTNGAAATVTNGFRAGIADHSAHHIYDYLHLVAVLGGNPDPIIPRLTASREEIESVAARFALTTSSPLFALNAGAEYGPAKRWPAERFAAVACEVQARTDCTWLILGGVADVPVAAEIESALRRPQVAVQNLAGKTSLGELRAVLAQCRVLLTNDTGPMHVAAALGVPVVVPFGSTSPRLTGPGLLNNANDRLLESDAPCAPCFLRKCPVDFRCMHGISVQRVVAAVQEAVQKHPHG